MKAIRSYFKGLSIAFRSLRMVTWIYLFLFVVAVITTIPFIRLVNDMTGNSLLPDRLINGFDATALHDMLKTGGKSLLFYLKGWWPLVAGFMLIQIWFNGGILYRVSNPNGPFKIAAFLRSAHNHFWRFLKLAVALWAIYLLLALLIFLPAMLLISLKESPTDQWIVHIVLFSFVIYLILVLLLNISGDIAKITLFNDSKTKVVKYLWRSIKFMISRFFSLILLDLMLLVLPVLVLIGYYLLKKDVITDTTGLILLFFVIQQMLIWLKSFFRIWRLGSLFSYYIRNLIVSNS